MTGPNRTRPEVHNVPHFAPTQVERFHRRLVNACVGTGAKAALGAEGRVRENARAPGERGLRMPCRWRDPEDHVGDDRALIARRTVPRVNLHWSRFTRQSTQ